MYICKLMEMSADKIAVLLFGTMGDIAETAGNALARSGYEARAIPFPQNLLHDECGYRRELLKAVKTFHPDIILPVGNTVAISRIKASVPGMPAIVAESPEKTELLDSKISSSALAARLGIPQPRMYGDAEEPDHFPVIFKRDVSFAGSGVYRPTTIQALRRIREHFAGKPCLVEEYIDGEDWSVDAIRSEGYFRYGCYRSLENRGQGPSIVREVADNPILGMYARTILDAVDWHGVCGMDFRVDRHGRPFFLECNPRLTGGLETQISAGFDIPSILVRLRTAPDERLDRVRPYLRKPERE